MDSGAWEATVHGVAKELDMTEQLNNNKNNNKLYSAWIERPWNKIEKIQSFIFKDAFP